MQIPQTPPGLTVFSCPDPEQAWIDAEGGEQERELEEALYAEDLARRLDGPCEGDGCESPGPLAIDGGEALCVDCYCGHAEGIEAL